MTVGNGKNEVTFLWFLLKATYFQKPHTCIGCFVLFTKLKGPIELVFTAGFLHIFSIKMFFLSNTLLNEQVLTFEESGLAEYMSRRLYGWPTANFRSFSKEQPS